MEITWRVISWEVEGEEGVKVQGMRSINSRYKIDRRRFRIEWEIKKPKNLYVQPMDMKLGGEMIMGRREQSGGE